MGGIQHSPAVCGPGCGVCEALKDGVSVFTAVAMPAQGRQSGRVGGVVGAGKATFARKTAQPGVSQASTRHFQQPRQLKHIAWLCLQLINSDQIIQRGPAQFQHLSKLAWVETEHG